jgi:hypothetical protein
MSVWYPQFPLRQVPAIIRITLFGAIVAGLYGALHDQASYSISHEYFTKMKFRQFSYLNFGWPERAFVAEVGFMGSWWVGLLAGYVVARSGLAGLPAPEQQKHVLRTFAIAIGIAGVCGLVGALLGTALTRNSNLEEWKEYQRGLDLQDLRSFVIVAYLHLASYVGAIIGLVVAVLYVRRVRHRASLVTTPA